MTFEPAVAERAPSVETSAPSQAAQWRAWAFLWGAFVIFCSVAGVGLFGLNGWRKTSYVSPPAQLVEKRGIVLYQGPRDSLPVSITEQTDLEEGGLIDVPASAEAVIQLRVDNSLIRLRSNSQLRLTSMRVGRFNRDLTNVRIEQLKGAANYQVAGALPGGRELEVRTPNTPRPQDGLKLTKGDYLVWVQPAGTRLATYRGGARSEASGPDVRLREGEWIVIGADRSEQRAKQPLPEHLIKNLDFAKGLGENWSPIKIGEKGRPDVGGTWTIEEEVINGQRLRTLRLTRDTALNTHNETGLSQAINREVWAFRSVNFSAWVKVNSASLDGGGYAGSEYPMLIRIHYVAENGGSYTWAHGFYSRNETGRPVEIGEQIPAGEWYHFTLDMTKLKDRPAYIDMVEVLASGHDFDAQIAGVDLTVE